METIWTTPTQNEHKYQFANINNKKMLVFKSGFKIDEWAVGEILNYEAEAENHEINIFKYVNSEEDAKTTAYEYAMKG